MRPAKKRRQHGQRPRDTKAGPPSSGNVPPHALHRAFRKEYSARNILFFQTHQHVAAPSRGGAGARGASAPPRRARSSGSRWWRPDPRPGASTGSTRRATAAGPASRPRAVRIGTRAANWPAPARSEARRARRRGSNPWSLAVGTTTPSMRSRRGAAPEILPEPASQTLDMDENRRRCVEAEVRRCGRPAGRSARLRRIITCWWRRRSRPNPTSARIRSRFFPPPSRTSGHVS